jgi:integrase
MGDSGLRREEAASARREHPRAVHVYGTLERSVWELTIIGKGQRERTVPVSAATLAALRAHWARPGRAFDEERVGEGPGGRLAPTSSAEACWRERRSSVLPKVDEAGYTADGLNRLIGCMTKKFVETMDALSRDERMRLGQVNAHAFRHYVRRRTISGERAKPHFRLVIVSVMTGAPIRSPDINPATLQPVQKSEQVVGRVETPRFAV